MDNLDKIKKFAEEVLRWSRLGLTGYRTVDDVLIFGVEDSVRIAEEFEGRVLDIGAGAGFPSVPAKIAFPHLEIYALESSEKKCAFLRYVKGLLELDGFEIIEGRAEDLKIIKKFRSFFDTVTARAIKPSVLVELALPYQPRRVVIPFGGKEPEIGSVVKRYFLKGRQRGVAVMRF